MKYTDRFFSIPVRIYDRFSLKKAKEREEAIDAPIEGEWTEGIVEIDHRDIEIWLDYFDSTDGIDSVKDAGFEYTLVGMRNGESFVSTMPRKEFKDRLNRHVDKWEKWADEEKDREFEKDLEKARSINTAGSQDDVL